MIAAGMLLLAAATPAAATVPAAPERYPISRPLWTHYYPIDANAGAEIDGAIAEARAGGRLPVLVLGADWCGDSRALAAILTSEMWQGEFGQRYRVVFVDVDHPTRDHGRNQDQIARFGITKMTGTPELLVLDRGGKPVNTLADALGWSNAGDRPVGAILNWFRDLPQPKP